MQRDVMNYDVLIVGAGPAGLAAAIRLKQLRDDISVCVLEKGAEVGAHIISGAVIDPIALNELLPDWKQLGAPLNTAVDDDEYQFLAVSKTHRIPEMLVPPLMRNSGNYIASLSDICKWLAIQAEQLGVEIYAGFSAQEPLLDDSGKLIGILTGDMGRNAAGEETAQFIAGIEIQAPYTLVAEGARGSLTKQIQHQFQLRNQASPEKYGLGIKEIWRVSKDKHQAGRVVHTTGWPLPNDTGGGGFIYHYGDNLVAIGLVVHLDYQNPYLSPFKEFQQYKTHPDIRGLLEGGKRISYGARAISEGGIQSLPELIFPGGALVGCSAGMVNVPRIKGSHNAMKSGMLAAESVVKALAQPETIENNLLTTYLDAIQQSWLWQDLYKVRNFKPLLSRFGTLTGVALAGTELWLASLGLNLPWTLQHKRADNDSLKPAAEMPKIDYLKPDGVLTFDILSSINLSNIHHDDDQPNHLKLHDAAIPVTVNLPVYDAPEQRYCPAGVYEIVEQAGEPNLQINAQNCIHCKTCDIKDPLQNINWVPPEGGSGPIYNGM